MTPASSPAHRRDACRGCARAPIVHHKSQSSRARPTFQLPNRRRAIRSRIRFWRATMRREAGERENFFVAKVRDSESARSTFHRPRRRATMSRTHRASDAWLTKTLKAQAIPAKSTIDARGFSRAIGVVMPTLYRVVERLASFALVSRVNTSLSRTLFFSMCWCIRDECISIPECTQRLSHLT